MEKKHRITDYFQIHKEQWLKMRYSSQKGAICSIETIQKNESIRPSNPILDQEGFINILRQEVL